MEKMQQESLDRVSGRERRRSGDRMNGVEIEEEKSGEAHWRWRCMGRKRGVKGPGPCGWKKLLLQEPMKAERRPRKGRMGTGALSAVILQQLQS